MTSTISESSLTNMFEMLIQRLTDLEHNVISLKDHTIRELLEKSEKFHGGIMGRNYIIERPNFKHYDTFIAVHINIEMERDFNLYYTFQEAFVNGKTGGVYDDLVKEAKACLGDKYQQFLDSVMDEDREDIVQNKDMGLKSIFLNTFDTLFYKVITKRFGNKGIRYFQSDECAVQAAWKYPKIMERYSTLELCDIIEEIMTYIAPNERIKHVIITEFPVDLIDFVQLALLYNGLCSCNKDLCKEKITRVMDNHYKSKPDWRNRLLRTCPKLYEDMGVDDIIDEYRGLA
jgi:hypothetical protein